jgi:hypothetical protein
MSKITVSEFGQKLKLFFNCYDWHKIPNPVIDHNEIFEHEAGTYRVSEEQVKHVQKFLKELECSGAPIPFCVYAHDEGMIYMEWCDEENANRVLHSCHFNEASFFDGKEAEHFEIDFPDFPKEN